ncbi:MAG: transcriptional regulator GcvA [Alphaproteobacteria bacterium]
MTRRLPSLAGLQAFEAVARHLSFTRAAQELNLTQTAVSHRIGRLEEQVGRRLFVRRNRRVMLTRQAQEYLSSVRAAFDTLYDSTDRLLRDDECGVLTVSTLISFAAKWLVPRLAAFHAMHPDIDVRFLTSSAPVDFESDEVDIAIRYGDGAWPGLRSDLLLQERLFPVCSPKLLDGPLPLRVPRDLAAHSLVSITTYVEDWAHWLSVAGIEGLTVRRELKFDLAFAAIEAIIDGAGVGMGRSSLVEYDLANGRLIAPFGPQVPRRAYYVVAPEAMADRPKVKLFRDWLLASV